MANLIALTSAAIEAMGIHIFCIRSKSRFKIGKLDIFVVLSWAFCLFFVLVYLFVFDCLQSGSCCRQTVVLKNVVRAFLPLNN